MKHLQFYSLGFILIFFSQITIICGQTISGNVVDENNLPIANALVIREDNSSVWVKTANNGSFVISGFTSTKFKIAALHFETRKNYLFPSNSNNNVVLQKDKLLDSDVYHISFDHLRPGDYYSKEELKNDFPVPSGAGFYEQTDETTNRAFVDTEISVDGGQSLRVRFPAGQLKTANSGVDTRIPLTKTYKDNDFDGDELYLSYWIKLSDNFQLDKCGGKLPSLGGSDLGIRNNEWKGRIMWRNGGSIQFYPELPHSEDRFEADSLRFWGEKEFDGGDICTNEFTPYLSEPGWHNIELHYILDNGTPNGFFEGWVDGGKGHKIINSEVFGFYRRKGEGLENLTTNAILLSAFLGGSSTEYEPTEDTYAWFDEFRVSRSRINEYEKYANGIITSVSKIENGSLVHPNPSYNGVFYLSKSTDWIIYDSYGSQLIKGNTSVVDLSNCSNGLYFLQSSNGIEKLIKNE